MAIYQFTVFRTAGSDGGSQFHRMHTNHNFVIDGALTEKDFGYYASMCLTAERVCSFGDNWFSHVVAYEVRDGKPFDAETYTHTMLNRNADFVTVRDGVRGLRAGAGLDRFFGLQYRRNRRTGYSETEYLPSCLGRDDVAIGRQKPGARVPVVLNMDGPLAKNCFPLPSNLAKPRR